MNFLTKFFPSTKSKWHQYFKTLYPVVLGSSLFSLNGFIDNFMVGKYNGVASVSAANAWTNIVIGLILGVAAAGGIISAQFFASKKYDSLVQMARFRYVFTTVLVVIMAILALVIPRQFVQVFLKQPQDASELFVYENNLVMAESYLKITVLQWLFFSVSGNLGNQLREIGHGRVTMYWGVASIFTNVTLNATLIYGFDLGVEGAAWASVMSRIVEITIGILYLKILKLPISFRLWTIFKFNKLIIKLFFSQFALFFSFSSMIGIVSFRNYFYDLGYPQGSIGSGIGAAAVLGLTNAIMNVFTSVFSASGIMAANFVGYELGQGNVKQAKINSNELKGFNTLMAVIGSLIIVIVALFVPKMTFLVNAGDKNIDTIAQLKNVCYTLLVISLFFPLWIWCTTSYRNSVSGGKSFWFSFGDWILNVIQLGWAWSLMVWIKDRSIVLEQNFWLTYMIFFMFDFTKLIWQEIAYNLIDWAQPIENMFATTPVGALENIAQENQKPTSNLTENKPTSLQ